MQNIIAHKRLITLLIIVASLFMVLIGSQSAKAEFSGTGYFYGNSTTTGSTYNYGVDDVLPGRTSATSGEAIPDSVYKDKNGKWYDQSTRKYKFLEFLEAQLNSSVWARQQGAAFIVNTMMGACPTCTYHKNQNIDGSSAMFLELRARVSSADITLAIEDNDPNDYGNGKVSFAGTQPSNSNKRDLFFDTYNASSRRLLVFKYTNPKTGGVTNVYAVEQACANPVGQMGGVPAQDADLTKSAKVINAADKTITSATPGTKVTFVNNITTTSATNPGDAEFTFDIDVTNFIGNTRQNVPRGIADNLKNPLSNTFDYTIEPGDVGKRLCRIINVDSRPSWVEEYGNGSACVNVVATPDNPPNIGFEPYTCGSYSVFGFAWDDDKFADAGPAYLKVEVRRVTDNGNGPMISQTANKQEKTNSSHYHGFGFYLDPNVFTGLSTSMEEGRSGAWFEFTAYGVDANGNPDGDTVVDKAKIYPCFNLEVKTVNHEKGSGNEKVVHKITKANCIASETVNWTITGYGNANSGTPTTNYYSINYPTQALKDPTDPSDPCSAEITMYVKGDAPGLDTLGPGGTKDYKTIAGANEETGSIMVYEIPYASFTGHDIYSGCGVGAQSNNDDPSGRIIFNTKPGVSVVGASVQYAAIALNGFNEATGLPVDPTPSLDIITAKGTGSRDYLKAKWLGGNSVPPPCVDMTSLPASGNSFTDGQVPASGYETASGRTITITNGTATGKSIVSSLKNAGVGGDVYINGVGPRVNNSMALGLANHATLLIYAEGDIYIDRSVTSLDAILVAEGTIYTCAKPSGQPVTAAERTSLCGNTLTINGALSANNIQFERSNGSRRLLDNVAGEQINFPAYLNFTSPLPGSSTNPRYQSLFNAPPYL